MSVIRVALDPGYDVIAESGSLRRVGELVSDRRRVAIVSQAVVADRYVDTLRAGIVAPTEVFLIGDGESYKSLATVDDLCSAFARWGLLRDDAIVALGGGMVGDTAGFAAAVYHRGVALVQVPTTLLAMVDAAIGGKTAVNLPEGKNLVGAFHQPVGVVADPDTLVTLSDREYASGLGEVAKYALMYDVVEDPTGLVDALRVSTPAIADRDPAVLADVIARCVAIKADVVGRDPHERSGLRATLNLGHTLAHALEIAYDHELTHGEAVAVGLVFAGALAGGCERVQADVVDRFRAIPFSLGLPVAIPDRSRVRPEELVALMARDKKASGGLTFILPGPTGLERVEDPSPGAMRYAFESIGYTDEELA